MSQSCLKLGHLPFVQRKCIVRHSVVFRYGAATMAVEVEDGIATAEVIGLASASVIERMRLELILGAHAARAAAIVADFRRAVVTVRPKNLPPMRGLTWDQAAIPVAFLVTPHNEADFVEHAWAMSCAGLLRAVFTDCGDAHEWARARAGVTSAWG